MAASMCSCTTSVLNSHHYYGFRFHYIKCSHIKNRFVGVITEAHILVLFVLHECHEVGFKIDLS